MGQISNSQSFSSSSNSGLLPGLASKWKANIDTVLWGGRDITIHLPPQKSQCPSSCRFNSTYKKYMSNTGGICNTCRGEGYLLENRYTVYRANIRQIDVPIANGNVGGEETPAGRISQRMVRTKTAISSYDHINKSIGATIDGEKYKLNGDLEKTGFGGTVYYVVATWKKMDK